jgi:aryl sulfotransferase
LDPRRPGEHELTEPRFGWLVSYPKSGNTWVRILLESLLNGGKLVDIAALQLRTPVVSREAFDEYFGIDSGILTEREIEAVQPKLFKLSAQRFAGPLMLRKVHDRCWRTWTGERMFPPELSLGAIYIVRDPRDVAVSLAHYYGLSLDEAIERLTDQLWTLSGSRTRYCPQLPQPVGDWSGHVSSWLDHSEMPVHLVRYEDLHLDTTSALIKIATFLGLSTEAADQAVKAARFDVLQEQENQKGFTAKVSTCKQFFREGRAGAWKQTLAPSHAARIVSDHKQVMERLGYL